MATSSMESQDPMQPNFGTIFSSTESTMAWLRQNNLLPNTLSCQKCGQQMKQTQKTDLQDGLVWSCCGTQRSIRTGTIFFHSKLKLDVASYLLFYFSKDVPAYIASRLLGTSVSYKSIICWYYKLRDICSKKLTQEPLVFDKTDVSFVTGEATVEIDESLFGKKAKSGRGTSQQKYSVFGIVEKHGRRCVLYLINDRKRATLVPLIERHVKTNCQINHDGFSSYSNLDEFGYTHSTVNHNLEFVTAEGIHTNTIEGLWGLLKQRIAKMHGSPSIESLAATLDEFSYRQLYSENGSIWQPLLRDIQMLGH